MHKDYVLKTVEALESGAAKLRQLLVEPPPDAEQVAIEIDHETRQGMRWLLHAFQPKPTGTWRDAIGCAPRAGGDEKPEDVIRKMRDEW